MTPVEWTMLAASALVGVFFLGRQIGYAKGFADGEPGKFEEEQAKSGKAVPEPEPMPEGFWDSRCARCNHENGCHAPTTQGGCVKCPSERRCIDWVPKGPPPAPFTEEDFQ